MRVIHIPMCTHMQEEERKWKRLNGRREWDPGRGGDRDRAGLRKGVEWRRDHW